MNKEKGITLISLIVTIIVLLILTGISISITLGENGILSIAKQSKENVQIAAIEAQEKLNELYTQRDMEIPEVNDLQNEASKKLEEFKEAIANYIEEAGGVKPDIEADEETFGDSIKGILKEVTKDATATAEDIVEGKTAWVNGNMVTGTLTEQSLTPDLSVTLKVTHTSQSGSTTKYLSVSTYLINTISISTSCSGSHYGSYSVTGCTADGTAKTLSGTEIDVSEYDSLIFKITCNGRNNSGFSQSGTYNVKVEKVD